MVQHMIVFCYCPRCGEFFWKTLPVRLEDVPLVNTPKYVVVSFCFECVERLADYATKIK